MIDRARTYRPATLVVALLAGSLSPCNALAQNPDTARVLLPGIEVNALRAGISLARAPLSRTHIAAPLVGAAGVSLLESVRTVPGVQLDDRHNQALGERLSIRGFGARAGFGIRGVRVLVDGIPATMPDGQTTLNHVDPARLASIEVVRGPAAAFLGNAAGGALLLRTSTQPGTWGEAMVWEGGVRRVAAGAGSSMGAVYGSWQRQDGQRPYNHSERAMLGGSAAIGVGRGRIELATHAVDYDAQNPGALTLEQFEAEPQQASANNVRQRTGERGTHAQLGAGWIAPLGGLQLEVRAHAGTRSLDNPIPPRIIELSRRFGGVRAQLSRAQPQLAAAIGAELELQHDDRQNYENLAGGRGALLLDQAERVRGLGAFAHAQWHPLETLLLFGAARADRYAFLADDHFLSNGDDSGERSLGALTGTFGAALRPASAIELFGNIGTAYETPTTTELANRPDGRGGFNAALEPEHTRAAELGLRLHHARAQGELTLFLADVRDKLIPFEVASAPGRQYYRNAARARHQGVEAAVEARPWPPLLLRAAWTRLDARFREYTAGGVDYSGARIAGAAAHMLEASAEASVRGAWRLRADVRRRGRIAANDANDAIAASYTLVDVRLAHAALRRGRLSLGWNAGIDNLLDRTYAAAVSVNAFGGRYYEPGTPLGAYFGVRLGWR